MRTFAAFCAGTICGHAFAIWPLAAGAVTFVIGLAIMGHELYLLDGEDV